MQDTKDLREFICDIGRRAWQKGMGAANDGNISILLDDNTVLCTPTGVSKGFMTPDMICRIDRAGNSVDGGAWKPSTETKMHLCVYDNRPDARAVVHAHPLYATVHAICGKPITQQIMPESTMFLGEVPLSPYALPSSEDLSKAIAPYLERHDAILLENHGALTCGHDLQSAWFTALMQVINNITMLSVILTGAALIREREHGTIEHLLVMPVTPAEIMLAKIWANGAVIILAAAFALWAVVERLLGVPVQGSIPLFLGSATLYLFSVTSLGILIATASTSMAQFGLIVMPVLIVMNLLSGSTTPLESMPSWLQVVMQVSPSTHFVALSQAILYRGAGLDIIWPRLAALVLIGAAYFGIALARFRKALLAAG